MKVWKWTPNECFPLLLSVGLCTHGGAHRQSGTHSICAAGTSFVQECVLSKYLSQKHGTPLGQSIASEYKKKASTSHYKRLEDAWVP